MLHGKKITTKQKRRLYYDYTGLPEINVKTYEWGHMQRDVTFMQWCGPMA